MKLECCAFLLEALSCCSLHRNTKNAILMIFSDIEHTVKALESQLCYDQHSPEEVARQILKAACKFYDADWCGLIQVDLDLKIWTPFWWYNDSSEDKTTILTEEFESAEFLD